MSGSGTDVLGALLRYALDLSRSLLLTDGPSY